MINGMLEQRTDHLLTVTDLDELDVRRLMRTLAADYSKVQVQLEQAAGRPQAPVEISLSFGCLSFMQV